MSVRYIANSTGVPEDYLFSQIGVPVAGNENKPLDLLGEEQRYRGGPRAGGEHPARAGRVSGGTVSLSDLSDTVLTYIVTYGAVALGVVVLLAAIGLPLPSTFFVLVSGAFVQQGALDLSSTVMVALARVVLGDTLSYGMGRVLRRPIHARFGQSETWLRAERSFKRRGALAIYLTRSCSRRSPFR